MHLIKLKPTLTYVIIVLLLGVSNVNGQTNKTNFLITAGYGEFEFLNLAAGMQIAQFAISLSAGFEPSEWRDKSLVISLNTFWHFGGESRHTDVRPWYFRPNIGSLES